MLSRKLFQLLVIGGAVVSAASGCATTSTAADGTTPQAKPQSLANPGTAMPAGGGGARGW